MIFVCYVRSGNIFLNLGELSSVGTNSNGWSSRTYNVDAYAYRLSSSAENVEPSFNNGGRYNAFPLRCLAD